MFASKASTQALRNGVRRTAQMPRAQPSRGMGGGGGKYVIFAREKILCDGVCDHA